MSDLDKFINGAHVRTGPNCPQWLEDMLVETAEKFGDEPKPSGQGINFIPADEFDYRGTFGPEECAQLATEMLSIAHEMATLLHAGQIRAEDLAPAHKEIYNSLKWALRWLGIPWNSSPDHRAHIRAQYLDTDPGPQKPPLDCYLTPAPANVPDGKQHKGPSA